MVGMDVQRNRPNCLSSSLIDEMLLGCGPLAFPTELDFEPFNCSASVRVRVADSELNLDCGEEQNSVAKECATHEVHRISRDRIDDVQPFKEKPVDNHSRNSQPPLHK